MRLVLGKIFLQQRNQSIIKMKKVNYILFLFLIFGCRNNDKKSLTDSKYVSVDTNTVIYEPIAKNIKILSDSLDIQFQSSFSNDTVKVSLGHIEVLKKIISTDNRIGLAESIRINKKEDTSRTIQIFINHNAPIKIVKYKNYKSLLINKANHTVKVQLTNRAQYYK